MFFPIHYVFPSPLFYSVPPCISTTSFPFKTIPIPPFTLTSPALSCHSSLLYLHYVFPSPLLYFILALFPLVHSLLHSFCSSLYLPLLYVLVHSLYSHSYFLGLHVRLLQASLALYSSRIFLPLRRWRWASVRGSASTTTIPHMSSRWRSGRPRSPPWRAPFPMPARSTRTRRPWAPDTS